MTVPLRTKGWTRSAGGAFVLAALAAVGCGGSKGKISGVVKLPDGTPLPSGQVTFLSQGPENKVAQCIIQDGKYSIENFPAGPAKIMVQTFPSSDEPPAPGTLPDPKLINMGPGMPPPREPPAGAEPGKSVMIDDKYKNPDTSGLDYEVTKGDQQHDIEVTKADKAD